MRARRARWIFSIRARTAFAAALATLLVFATGGWWLRGVIRDQWEDDALEKATRTAFAITSSVEAGKRPTRVDDSFLIVVLQSGRWAVFETAIPEEMLRFDKAISLPRVDGVRPATRWHTTTIAFPRIMSDRADATMGRQDYEPWPIAGRTQRFAVGVTDVVAADRVRRLTGLKSEPAQRITVYALASDREAETAVATVDRFLRWTLPAAVVFVGVISWLVTGRALRPVDAIRSKMDEISGKATGQRVPVPSGSTEIALLARATNETLDRLEHALTQQRRFVADASHELRSPLAGLRSALEIPLVHPEGTDWPAVVATALTDTIRLQALTDDLLLLASDARDESGELTDLADLAEEQVAERGGGEPPAFVVRAAERVPPVRGSELRLGRVIRNLLDNAARHARTEVRVTVTADAEDGMVTLTVADDGPGIPEADRERVFDRFVRLDSARARATGGAGLGLTIVRELVTGHGGTVHATDAGLVVRLPAAT